MEDYIRTFVLKTALMIEGAAALLVAFAAMRAFLFSIIRHFRESGPLDIRLVLGRWLALALEFLVAADILRTSVAPSWDDIGKLASIVLLRTALNYFLEREIKRGREQDQSLRKQASPSARQPALAHGDGR